MKTIAKFFFSASVVLFAGIVFGHSSLANSLGEAKKMRSGSHTISARLLSEIEIQSINSHSTEWIELKAGGDLANSRFRLLDANGNAIEKGSFKNGSCRMDVSGISSGKYQIEVFTGEEWVYQSIILL